MKKGMALGLGIFLSLIISLAFVSALGTKHVCLREGEYILFSKCNPEMEDFSTGDIYFLGEAI